MAQHDTVTRPPQRVDMAVAHLRLGQGLATKFQVVSQSTSASPPTQSFDPYAEQSGPSWAHVSGWAQLSGQRRTVSCIVPCDETAAGLATLLPVLSDTLTEYGYPWETIAVDCDNSAHTRRLLARWTELPGFRWVRGGGAFQRAAALATGLCYARGDVVIVADTRTQKISALITDLISRWDSGALFLYSVQDTLIDASPMVWPDELAPPQAHTRQTDLRAVMSAARLIDRRLVARLLRHTDSWASTS
jgi:hypothetical protein